MSSQKVFQNYFKMPNFICNLISLQVNKYLAVLHLAFPSLEALREPQIQIKNISHSEILQRKVLWSLTYTELYSPTTRP